MSRHPPSVLLGVALVLGGRLAAQTDSMASQAAAGITAASIARHLGMLADDSLRGRDPGRSGLERTARYVSAQFHALGLTPFGDTFDRTWIQRYPLADHLTVDYEESVAWFAGQADHLGRPVVTEGGDIAKSGRVLDWGTDIIVAGDTVADPDYAAFGGVQRGFQYLPGKRAAVLAGPQTAASARQTDLRGDVVIYLPPPGTDSMVRQQVVDVLRRSSNVVVITEEDSAAFVKRRRASPSPVVLDKYDGTVRAPQHWVVYVREGAVRDALRVGGADIAELRTARTPITRAVTIMAEFSVRGVPPPDADTAPNVVGLLPARDSQATGYVVFTASMDHAGVDRGRLDRLSAGADANSADAHAADANAVSVAGLLVLAQAFRRLGAQLGGLPRPIIFAAVSGSAVRFQGSTALAKQLGSYTAIDLNLDLRGRRGGGDSVWVAGLQDVVLPTPAAWVAAQHSELGLTVADGGTIATATSDHFPFVWNGIPSLSISPRTPGINRPDDAFRVIDADQEARLLRFLFYLGRDIASSTTTPYWTLERRRQRLQLLQGAP